MKRQASWVTAAIISFLGWAAACGPMGRTESVKASWALDPALPASGRPTQVILTLQDGGGAPVRGARLHIEAHMSHPGMTPVMAEMRARSDGVYEANLELTMAGRWTLVASGALPGGARLNASLDLEDVK